MTFSEFDLHPRIMAGIQAAGYVTPTPIQAQTIPAIRDGHDVMGLAQTGTGKTAAFALPILHHLMSGVARHTRVLIVAPTRELAEQIYQETRRLASRTRIGCTTAYGGVGLGRQLDELRRRPEIVVGCPGRILDLIGRRALDLSKLETLVLDEADHMFDMGFFPDIRRILAAIPRNRQTLLFSATMPDEVRGLAEDVLTDPVVRQVSADKPTETVRHAFYPVSSSLKNQMLMTLIDQVSEGSVLVFTRTKHGARNLGERLTKAGHAVAVLQGNLSQNRRQAALDGFRRGHYRILVATDIAARGIDVSRVSHVINFDIPDTPEAYIHRIGRTGRAGRDGEAYTLITPDDSRVARSIDRLFDSPVERRRLADFDYRTQAPAPRPNLGGRPARTFGQPSRRSHNSGSDRRSYGRAS